MEIREIPGMPRYFVSDDGRVFSNKTVSKELKEIKPRTDKRGRKTVMLSICNKQFTKLVWWLVAEAFIPHCEGKDIIIHKDGDASNNNVDNLMRGTKKDCTDNRRRIGVSKHLKSLIKEGGFIPITDETVPVEGFDGYYVTRDGKVLFDVGEGRLRYVHITSVRGYYQTARLYLNDEAISVLLHRVLAKAFIPNPDNLPCINHKDGNKHNNDLSNIEWCTVGDNNRHALATGLRNPPRGSRNGSTVLTEEIVAQIKSVLAEGKLKQMEIARMFNVSLGVIGNIKRNINWRHVKAV